MTTFRGEGLLAVEWTLIGVALVLIIARVNLRLRYLRVGFVLSDIFIFSAFTAGLSLTALDTWLHNTKVYEADVDFSLSNWNPTDEVRVQVYKTFFSLYFPFYLEQYLNKGTLIALYFEIFGQHESKTRMALFLISAFCIIGFTITLLTNLFYCSFGCYWSLENPCPARCVVIRDNLGWAFHFASDIFVFVLPLVCISRLNMSRAQRISAGLTFCLGFINISITLARWFVVQSVFSPNPALTVGEVLAVSDGHSALIISILPSLRPYLRIFKGEDLDIRHKRLASGSSAGGSGSQPSAIRKETTTCQEISYPRIDERALSLGVPDIFTDNRSVRSQISVHVNGHPV